MKTLGSQRLIEVTFPLRQVSVDSVHEKNVRHGHISTLHIWPARRPLAASRGALLATLLREPDSAVDRRTLLGRIAGRIVEVPSASDDRMKEETQGGILHWCRESKEEGAAEIENLRAEVRSAFGGRAPRVLDPFAGGGAIPLEVMRLGCEAVAADLNPVAWFTLHCTLHYPHRLAGQARALPEFALRDQRFVEGFLKAQGITGKTALREELARLGHGDGEPVQVDSLRTDDDEPPASRAGLARHLRAWGQRVLDEVRRQLAARYPTYIEGRAGRLGERMTAVVVDGQKGKEYRLPTEIEVEAARVTEEELDRLYAEIPFGLPDEPISPERPSPNSRGLWHHELFARMVQALIELAEGGSEERTTLKSIQNHIGARGAAAAPRQVRFQLGELP